MGGGDLNTKKSWHPNTMKNQERVWKAEQQEAAEKRRLNELRREIDEERNREELKSIAKKSGILPNDDGDDKKLEWMYKGPSQLVNREEYLLGRTIDRTFEELDAQEKASTSTFGVAQPKNHVEHECIPFSIRQHKDMVSNDQVDLARKLTEDPLMMIKQKQIESRQKILQNPVKLKELHRLLKRDESLKDTEKKMKKDKKSRKSKKNKIKKKRSKKGSSSSDTDSDSDVSANLDQLLAEKYKKVQNSMAEEDRQGVSFDKLLTMKYQKLSKELDIMGSSNLKNKKHHRYQRKHASSESDRELEKRSDVRQENRKRTYDIREERGGSRSRSRLQELKKRKGASFEECRDGHNRSRKYQNFHDSSYKHRSRSRSQETHRNRPAQLCQGRSPTRKDRSMKNRRIRSCSRSISPARNRTRESKRHSRSQSPQRKRSGRSSSRSRSPARKQTRDSKRRSRLQSHERKKPTKGTQLERSVKESTSTSDSSSGSDPSAESSPSRSMVQYSERGRDGKKVNNFGLVSASGEKLKTKSQSTVRLYKPEEIKAEQSKRKPSWSKPTATTRSLTEKEMEQKRMAMMSNAQWREKDREITVRRYDEEDHREAARCSRDYDKDFSTKQFKRAAASETVESRIRSNRNNIQRSNGAMDKHFAKR